MRKSALFALIGIFLLVTIYLTKSNAQCQNLDSEFCSQDGDCICNENPCFLGNKEYYNKCFLPRQKGLIQACPDACGFGPYDIEFKTICENNQCKLSSFNRTTGERIG